MVSSGGVFSSQPRKILHSFQYTLLGRAKCTRHAQKHEPQSHTSRLRRPPASRVTPARTHPPFTHVPASSPRSHPPRTVGHRRQVTRARCRPPPSRAQTETPTVWRLPGPGSAAVATRTGLSPQNRPDSVRASTPCQKWASPHSTRAPGQLSPNRDAGIRSRASRLLRQGSSPLPGDRCPR